MPKVFTSITECNCPTVLWMLCTACAIATSIYLITLLCTNTATVFNSTLQNTLNFIIVITTMARHTICETLPLLLQLLCYRYCYFTNCKCACQHVNTICLNNTCWKKKKVYILAWSCWKVRPSHVHLLSLSAACEWQGQGLCILPTGTAGRAQRPNSSF